jgi:hypothetical protein
MGLFQEMYREFGLYCEILVCEGTRGPAPQKKTWGWLFFET